MKTLISNICRRLQIKDFRFVEIESKKRVQPKIAKDLKKYLHKKTDHEKNSSFFDQFLDTPRHDLLRLGASLRIRYKGNGTRIYLQYKGPGFLEEDILFRSEFSSKNLKDLILEESHHDIIQFNDASIKKILKNHVQKPMADAMRRHLGAGVISRISTGPVISIYKKEKFTLDLGSVFLEPSLDRVFAFHISKTGLHPLSTFWEFENEIKATGKSLAGKIEYIPKMMEFDAALSAKFNLKPEPLDKYHRCGAIFLR